MLNILGFFKPSCDIRGGEWIKKLDPKSLPKKQLDANDSQHVKKSNLLELTLILSHAFCGWG